MEGTKHNAAEILRELAVQQRSVSALLWLGRVEVGRVDLSMGEVVHAEIPGAVGDAALRLLPRLPGIRVTIDDLRGDRRTVGPHWRDLLGMPPSPAEALAAVVRAAAEGT